MQTVVISDVHIGTNYKTCWYQQSVHEPYILALLDYILQNANRGTNPVNRLVVLGDLFDFWTYPPSMVPPTIDDILAANPNLFGPNGKFSQVVKALNGNVQYIHGNHDILLTQPDLNKIPGGGHQIQLLPDIYPDASGIVFTHGHLATMFNAPDARYSGQVPVGHFVTRAICYMLDTQTLKPGQTAANLPDQGSPYGFSLSSLIPGLSGQFTNPSITSLLLDYVAERCKFSKTDPIQMGKGQAPTTISAAKTKYDGLFMQWVAQNGGGEAGITIAAKSAQADYDGRYMAWFAQQFAFRNNAKGIVMGHTHTPKVGIVLEEKTQKKSWCQYVNSGFECPSIPDIQAGKTRWNFTMIAQDGTMQLMQVTGGSYQIQPASAPPDEMVYAPFLDYSCYVKINNNSPIAALDASGNPAGYARSDGTNSVVYRGANNHIYELYLAPGRTSWISTDLSGAIGAPAASGDPAGYVRSDKINSVVYRGTNNHIYELYLQPGTWISTDLSGAIGAPEASGNPVGYARSDGTNSVVYRGTNNHIYELFLEKSRNWQYGDLSAKSRAPEASGDPAGYARSDGTNSVVYRGTNNHIYELYLEKSRDWQYGDLSAKSGAPEASGDPAGYARSDGTNSVVYRGANNHIYELYLPPGRTSWISTDLSGAIGAPAASGDPAGYVRSDKINSVVYRGTNNHIYELYLQPGTWISTDLSGAIGAPVASGDPVGYVRSDKINAVVYRGTKHIYELSLLDVWHYSDLAVPELVLQTSGVSSGFYATKPPARIPANQTGEFWIEDLPGLAGSAGTATYISDGKPFALSFSCPTGLLSNTASGGAALLASSENPPSPKSPYNQVPSGGHPLFVEFFIPNPAPAG